MCLCVLCNHIFNIRLSLQALSGIVTLFFSVGLAIYYDWRLGLVTSLFTPILLVAMLFQMRLMTKDSGVKSEAFEKSAKVAVESINNVRTVAGLRCEEKIQKDYGDALEEPSKNSRRNAHLRGLTYGVANSFMFFAYGSCFAYGGYLLVEGLMENPFDIWKVAVAILTGIGQCKYHEAETLTGCCCRRHDGRHELLQYSRHAESLLRCGQNI